MSALLLDAIQTDAAINPGNSGGALVDCSGKLIGVPTAGATVSAPTGESSIGNVGLGFAIPINLATNVADEIIATGRVQHAFLGVQTQPVSPNATTEHGVAEGLRVADVTLGGPSERAGLRAGDVIISIEGEPAVSTDQLMVLTLRKRPGDRVELRYRRDGSERTATVTLAARS